MKRRIVLISIIGLFLMMLPLMAGADQAANGSCGENLTWFYDGNSTLTITGTGPMTDYWGWNDVPWLNYYSISNVILPEGLTTIGDLAFAGINIQSIIIPNSVTQIGMEAFEQCPSLTSVSLPEGLRSIGLGAFSGCPLSNIEFPDSLESIGVGAFSSCNLVNVLIPQNVETIGANAFGNCKKLQSINVISNNIYFTSVDGVLFNKEKTIIIQCPTKKTDVNIPESVHKIEAACFSGCSNLESIFIPDSVKEIESSAFSGCTSLISISIPEGVSSVKDRMFQNCGKLENVYIPDSVTYIGESAFRGCSELKNIQIPENTTSIGDSAFWYCNISEVSIPVSVTSIGNGAFYECRSLTDVFYSGTIEQWQEIVIGNINDRLVNSTIHCLLASGSCGSSLKWKLDENGTLTISGTGEMDNYQNCQELPWYNHRLLVTSIVVEYGVTSIGEGAFDCLANLRSIMLADGLTSIGDWAFNECANLTNIIIPDSVTHIGVCAFFGCSSLTEIYIPPNVSNISGDAFYECTNLAAINVSEENSLFSSIDGVLFKNGTWLYIYPRGKSGEYSVPDGITKVSFPYNYNLIKVTLPDSISDLWFFSCQNLEWLSIPSSITSISDQAFYGCNKIKEVYYSGTDEQWNNIDFGNNYTNFKNATIHCHEHSWGSTVYEWAEDNSIVTATCICTSNSTHILSETVQTISEITKLSTCETNGETTYTATFTNTAFMTQTKTVDDVPALGHATTAHTKVDATCTEAGTEAYWECETCGELFSDAEAKNKIEAPIEIAVKGHTLTAHAEVDSTCTATGTEAYWECEVCGDLFSDEEGENKLDAPVIIAAKVHILTAFEPKGATCTTDGTEAYWKCEVCNKLFKDEECTKEIEAPIVVPASGHMLTAHTKVESTCTETGTEAYWECEVCGDLFSDEEAKNKIDAPVVISTLGHDWNNAEYKWAKDNSTVTATRTCKNDASHIETETATVMAEITAPTETTEGTVKYTSAEFSNDEFTVQTKNMKIPALSSLSVIHLPSMLTMIEDEAFENLACEAIIIPNSCTSIGNYAFRNCKNLKYIRVPAGIDIPSNAFEGCENVVIDRTAE